MLWFKGAILLVLCNAVFTDVYMQNPRGSNNRWDKLSEYFAFFLSSRSPHVDEEVNLVFTWERGNSDRCFINISYFAFFLSSRSPHVDEEVNLVFTWERGNSDRCFINISYFAFFLSSRLPVPRHGWRSELGVYVRKGKRWPLFPWNDDLIYSVLNCFDSLI